MPTLDEIQRQINGEISSLQENLKALNEIKIELEEAKNLVKDHIKRIDEYIRSIQTNSINLLNLLSKYADETKEHTIKEISRGIATIESATDNIVRVINSLKEDIKNLLKVNQELVQEATKLFSQIEEINFPERLSEIDKGIEQINSSFSRFEKKVDNEFIGIKSEINLLHKSNSELKKQNKNLMYFLIGISIVSIIILIYLVWKLHF
jgi:prefoldin subunit 5